MKNYSKYTFFYGGPFSNWYPAEFEDANRVKYTCSEQYMMYHKAILFKDFDVAEQIMETPFPAEQKALGKTVKNFNRLYWEKFARNIVLNGCFYKFTQNKDCRVALYESAGTLLVEASPTDIIWGIGLGEYDPKRFDRNNWKGMNWLGEVLTILRENMFGE